MKMVTQNLLKLILACEEASFLSKRKQKVVVDGSTSKDTDVTSGVPEGTVLGPILFLICISDIGENIKSSKKVYVDDTKLESKL